MQGLEKFREYMSGFRSHYVVIGGLATVLTLEDRGLPARATKDVIDGLVDEGLLVRSKSGKLSMGKEYKRIAKEMSGGKNGDGNGQLDGQLRDQLEGQLNESQKITLEYIRQHEGDNTTAVSNGLDKPFRTIDKHIKVLLKLGLIERRGGKRTGGYYPL